MKSEDDARRLAEALVATSNGAGCRAAALITDMSQPLAPAAGNALEVAVVMEALTAPRNSRLVDLTLALGAELMVLAGLDAIKGGDKDSILVTASDARPTKAAWFFNLWYGDITNFGLNNFLTIFREDFSI